MEREVGIDLVAVTINGQNILYENLKELIKLFFKKKNK